MSFLLSASAIVVVVVPLLVLVGRRLVCKAKRPYVYGLARSRPLGVVVTGGTRGLGASLVEAFLRRGDRVVFCGRDRTRVTEAEERWRERFGSEVVYGVQCDVTVAIDVVRLIDFASLHMGHLDIWINNAGSLGERGELWTIRDEHIRAAIDTNLVGSLLCCKYLIMRILATAREPDDDLEATHIFNVDGNGSRGNTTPRTLAYGLSKRAIPGIAATLNIELDPSAPIGIHTLSPGMVLTDLLLEGSSSQHRAGVFNVLCEHPDVVASWLVEKITKIRGRGKYIRYLTMLKVIWRFLSAPFRKRKYFDRNGVYINREYAIPDHLHFPKSHTVSSSSVE